MRAVGMLCSVDTCVASLMVSVRQKTLFLFLSPFFAGLATAQLCGRVGANGRKYPAGGGAAQLITAVDRFQLVRQGQSGYNDVADQQGRLFQIHQSLLYTCPATATAGAVTTPRTSPVSASASRLRECSAAAGSSSFVRTGCRARLGDNMWPTLDCERGSMLPPFAALTFNEWTALRNRAQQVVSQPQVDSRCCASPARDILCAALSSVAVAQSGGPVPASPGQPYPNPRWVTGVQGGSCDAKIASIFSETGAVAAASGWEPMGFDPRIKACQTCTGGDPSGTDRSRGSGADRNQYGHLNGYSGHIYGTRVGIDDVNLFIPPGFTTTTPPSGNDSVTTFFYPRLGAETNVLLCVYHVRNFGVDRNRRNANGSIFIGQSGGPGGDTPYYRHSHLEVHSGHVLGPMSMRSRTRKFFSKVFCQ